MNGGGPVLDNDGFTVRIRYVCRGLTLLGNQELQCTDANPLNEHGQAIAVFKVKASARLCIATDRSRSALDDYMGCPYRS